MTENNAKLESIILKIIAVEGKFSNNRHDSGGETMWGITKATARKYGYTGEMRQMPKNIAIGIYKMYLQDHIKINELLNFPYEIVHELADTAVNGGGKLAGRILQEELNQHNKSHLPTPLWSELKVDGDIGNKTRLALTKYLDYRKKYPLAPLVLADGLLDRKSQHYDEITAKYEKNEEFYYGWKENRVLARRIAMFGGMK